MSTKHWLFAELKCYDMNFLRHLKPHRFYEVMVVYVVVARFLIQLVQPGISVFRLGGGVALTWRRIQRHADPEFLT
ncbi:MAG: hypothetical protein ACRETQ_06550 [Gammaproteobacteria bacterium]